MDVDIIDNAARQRLEALVEGQTCVLDYRLGGGTMAVVHTGVPPALEGRGIAAALTRFAFDLVRERGWRIDPRCTYTQAWLRRHPDQADLVVDGG